MPIVIRKIRNKPLYTVKNLVTKKVYSKGTTKDKAKSQKRLLEQIEARK